VSRDFCDHKLKAAVLVYVVLYVGGELVCFVASFFIDVDVLIWPEDAQKYVSCSSCIIFPLLFDICFGRVASVIYCNFQLYRSDGRTSNRING